MRSGCSRVSGGDPVIDLKYGKGVKLFPRERG